MQDFSEIFKKIIFNQISVDPQLTRKLNEKQLLNYSLSITERMIEVVRFYEQIPDSNLSLKHFYTLKPLPHENGGLFFRDGVSESRKHI